VTDTPPQAGSAAHLFGLLRSLHLPLGDYAVFGSGPLLVRGIIERANDLDVLCRGEVWARVSPMGPHTRQAGGPVVNLFGGLITLGTGWAYGSFDVDDLIDTAEVIDDIPFVRLEHVVAYKRAAGRPKDLEHLRLLADYQSPRA
jgi:hypothetical protein